MNLSLKLLPALVAAVLVGTAVPANAAVPVLVIDGEGFGHGVGMAQDGAYWMGRSGSTTEQILGHFYPGVDVGRSQGAVRVVVLTDDNADTVLTFPNGGDVRSPLEGDQRPGFPMHVQPGGAVRVVHDGEYHVLPAGSVSARSIGDAQLLPLPEPPSTSSTTTPPGPSTTVALGSTTTTTTSPERRSGTSIWAVPAGGGTIGASERGARYRGAVEASAAGGPLRLVNELDVEQYLRGMGEVRDPAWPAASLRAQAIAARTYALRAMKASGEICDTQRCQVYLGQQAEYGAMDKAVTATAGRVLMYRGGFAAAVYSANGAGVSASPEEGFGTPDATYPYLRAAAYETHSPDPWQVRVALTDVARRVNYRGELSDVRVATTGPSGRPTRVTLVGTAGDRTIPAYQLDDVLGLRSTKWKTRIELGDAPPEPLALPAIQALPEQTAMAAGAKTSDTRHPVGATVHNRHRSTRWLLPVVLAALAAGAVVGVVRGREGGDGEPSPPFDVW